MIPEETKNKTLASGLTESQELFCYYHITEGLSIVKAMKQAGYEGATDKILSNNGSAMLKKKHVRDYVSRLIDETKYNRVANSSNVLKFLKDTMQNEDASIRDRLKAAELLGKTDGIFVDNKVITDAESHQAQASAGWERRKAIMLANDPEKALKLGIVSQAEYDDAIKTA